MFLAHVQKSFVIFLQTEKSPLKDEHVLQSESSFFPQNSNEVMTAAQDLLYLPSESLRSRKNNEDARCCWPCEEGFAFVVEILLLKLSSSTNEIFENQSRSLCAHLPGFAMVSRGAETEQHDSIVVLRGLTQAAHPVTGSVNGRSRAEMNVEWLLRRPERRTSHGTRCCATTKRIRLPPIYLVWTRFIIRLMSIPSMSKQILWLQKPFKFQEKKLQPEATVAHSSQRRCPQQGSSEPLPVTEPVVSRTLMCVRNSHWNGSSALSNISIIRRTLKRTFHFGSHRLSFNP